MLSSGRAKLRDSVKVGAMFPEACTLQAADKMTSPRVLDTHVPLKLFPKGALKSKIIYTVRNPKDACVSFYHHQKGMSMYRLDNVSWEGTLELMINGKAYYGNWFDHVEEWLKVLENNSNALIVTYEDMKMDFKKQVRRVAEFLGYKRSDKFYDDVAKLCSFGYMKKEKREIKSAWSKESEGIYRKAWEVEAAFQSIENGKQVVAMMKAMPAKSCSLDPLPTYLVKDCIEAVFPALMKITNTSFESGIFPDL
ncbi:sulfotransferase 1C2-like [Lingula anatina]|uniref:Sulfotransferase 1C2-like n=1 Tax=Lingula anatina TaxID=7574 RepID=A0A1S3IEA7_LINAN|nr:sulfotransferase 1C2-like [Lingula anatina]|eukprot:XP_013395789.1 sulfotransferase 1C2-like [Lingula anatina]